MDTKQSSTQRQHQDPSHNMCDILPYDSIRTDNPLYPVAQFYKGCALYKRSSLEGAIDCFDQVQKDHNFYGPAQFYKAQCLYKKNKFHAAKETLSNISQYEIFFPKVLNFIKICEHNIQQLERYDQFESIINMQKIQNTKHLPQTQDITTTGESSNAHFDQDGH